MTALDHATPAAAPKELILSVGGMHCASCVGRVEQAACKAPGVTGATVNLASGRAFVTLADPDANAEAVAQAIRDAGFEAEPLLDAAEQASRDDTARFDESRALRNAFLLA